MEKKIVEKSDKHVSAGKKKFNYKILLLLGLLVLTVVALTVFNAKESVDVIDETGVKVHKDVKLTILNADCDECFDISLLHEALESQFNISAELVMIHGEEAVSIAKKYGIVVLPCAFLSGDIDDLELPQFSRVDDVLIFEESLPPFFDLVSGEVKGKVDVIQLLDSSCVECFNVSFILKQLGSIGVFFDDIMIVEKDSEAGKDLIEKYSIVNLPTIIFNNELLEYAVITDIWDSVGSKEVDGSLVLRVLNPPYLDLESGNIKGLVEMTYLVDRTCDECYNHSMHKSLLEMMFGLSIFSEVEVDVNDDEGRALVEKYDIDLVPSFLLSSDAGVYPEFSELWPMIGTEEVDGIFVFRAVDEIGPILFKNLSSGELIDFRDQMAFEDLGDFDDSFVLGDDFELFVE